MIRLDAATLAQVLAGNGPVVLADETGKPVARCVVAALDVPDREPELTEDEWDALANDPVDYSLEEVWVKIKRGETF